MISLAGRLRRGDGGDNAIVVLENIDRHLALGERPFEAAYRGAKEVWGRALLDVDDGRGLRARLTIKEESASSSTSRWRSARPCFSLLVSITVIPMAGSRFLRARIARASGFAGHSIRCSDWRLGIVVHRRLLPADPPDDASEPAGHGCAGGRLADHGRFRGAELDVDASGELPARRKKNFTWGMMFNPPGYWWSSVGRQPPGGGARPYWEAKDSAEATARALFDMQTGKPIPRFPPWESSSSCVPGPVRCW